MNLNDIDYIIKLATEYITNIKETMEFYQWKYWEEEKKVRINYDKTAVNRLEDARYNYSYRENDLKPLIHS